MRDRDPNTVNSRTVECIATLAGMSPMSGLVNDLNGLLERGEILPDMQLGEIFEVWLMHKLRGRQRRAHEHRMEVEKARMESEE